MYSAASAGADLVRGAAAVGLIALTRNLDADQLAALSVTNTGSQPLWLRLISSGYPSSAPEPPATFCRLNDKYWGPMVSANRCPRCVAANWCWPVNGSGRSQCVDAGADLLRPGWSWKPELADSSASLPRAVAKCKICLIIRCRLWRIFIWAEFRDDRGLWLPSLSRGPAS